MTIEIGNATASAALDVGRTDKRSATCQAACDSLHHALLSSSSQSKQQVETAQSSNAHELASSGVSVSPTKPATCELFCHAHGCTCLLPWTDRCQVNSCASCPECFGLTPEPTSPQATPQPTELEATPSPTAAGCTMLAGWTSGECVNKPSDSGLTFSASIQADCAPQCVSQQSPGCCYWKPNDSLCKLFAGATGDGASAGGRFQGMITCSTD